MNFLKFGLSKSYIVFLHGWGANKNSFLWTREFFENYSLIFVDFDGFGESPEPKFPLTVDGYANNLKTILDNYEIKKLVLVGHSFGGRVAIKFLSKFQNLFPVTKLLLVDSAGIKPRRGLNYYFKIFQYKIIKKLSQKRPELKEKLDAFGSSDYKKLSPIMKETFKNIVNEDLSFDAKKIQSQTILMWGKNDKETPIYMAKKLSKLINNSVLKVYENAGHFSFLDYPNDFLKIIDTLIEN
ncbi:MAG: alpha/beta hydrolase [Clostridia bacterium]|nr:alpha/beta hydrolase [Clostridia bacterium]